MARRSWLSLAAFAACCALTAPRARADTPDLQIAIYAPWSGPSTADDRYAFALDVQRAVADAGLGKANVSTYAKLADFRRALATGSVDVALLDSGATSALGKKTVVRAAWSSGTRWVLAGAADHDQLAGLRLALQAPDAPSSSRTVSRLLRGQATSKLWGKIVGAPVTADARELVLRGRADVVIVPARDATGLEELASIGTFSELALAVTETRPGAVDAAAVVRAAVLTRFGGSWVDGKPVFPRAVGANAFVSAPSAAGEVSFLDLLSPADSAPPALDIDAMWMEPNAP